MKSRHSIFPYAAMIVFAVLSLSTAAAAQATRTWVSGVGDDVNPCSRTAPCKTFAGAISKTATNGEINCLDPGGFGGVTITKSITIDCEDTQGSILNAGTNGVLVNITNAADTLARFVLRGVSIQGAGTGLNGIRILNAKSVSIEYCAISGNNSTGINGRGISDVRTNIGGTAVGAGNLLVINSDIRNNLNDNIVINPGASVTVNATISSSRIADTPGSGLVVDNNANVLVRDSVFAGNQGFGLGVAENSGSVDVNVENSSFTNNNVGVSVFSGSPIVRLSNAIVVGNSVGIAGANIFSFGNNRIAGNNSGNGPFAPANILPQQ